MLKHSPGKLMLIVVALSLCPVPKAFSQSPTPTPTPTPRQTRRTFTVQIEVSANDSPGRVDRASVEVESKEAGAGFRKATHTDRQGMATFSQVPQGKLRIQVVKQGYDTFGDDYTLLQDNQTIKITLKNARQPN